MKVPGVEGEYGITAGHTPVVSQMKPGIVSIVHGAGEEPEKFFVSGGFAFTAAMITGGGTKGETQRGRQQSRKRGGNKP